MTGSRPWAVLKFGGTSVSSAARWRNIAAVLRDTIAAGERPLVVCSAMSGVSNALEALLEETANGRDHEPGFEGLHRTHSRLAAELGLEVTKEVGDLLSTLERDLRGASLTREVTPRVRARVLACGEFLSTRLGAAWLNAEGLATSWVDARELLTACEGPRGTSAEKRFLSATCSSDEGDVTRKRLRDCESPVVLTQGFIARGPGGNPALLGRGGSDTSAAYLAARVGARRLEIWTDVPGLFTADPRRVKGARLLRHLGYDEAAEFANRGAKVLHPRCLEPVARRGIPLAIRCTRRPLLEGTVVSPDVDRDEPKVKAVLARKGMTLVSMDVDARWQRVGLIADLAACFRAHELSLDVLASSPTNFTVALDAAANHLDPSALDRLLADLQDLCEPSIVEPTAAVSVVGTSLRAILHELAPVLERLGPEKVYLVAQAADDMSLTFVVDEPAADRVVADLHEELLVSASRGEGFGSTFEELGLGGNA